MRTSARVSKKGETLAKILPAEDHELAVLAAGSTTATADALVDKVRHIASLTNSSYVPEIGRFSKPPQLRDVHSLTLDPVDLDAIRRCRPGRCDLKLTAPEIARFQDVIAQHGDDWKGRTEEEFRHVVIDRVTAYLRQGQSGIPPYADGGGRTDLTHIFSGLLGHSTYLSTDAARLAKYLENYPAVRTLALKAS